MMWRERMRLGVRVAVMVMVLCAVGGCAQPKSTLVIVVGGLGFSQLGDLREAVKEQCPDAKVISAGGVDGFKSDIREMAAKHTKQERVVLVGHSFGCGTIASAAEDLPRVDLAVFIDPAWNDVEVPRKVTRTLWYRRSEGGLVRKARVIGATGPTVIQGGHNDLPHAPVVIAGVVEAINRLASAEKKGKRGSGLATAGRQGG